MKIKKLLATLLTVLMLFGTCVLADENTAEENNDATSAATEIVEETEKYELIVDVELNGKKMSDDVRGISKYWRSMVPFAPIMRELGYEVKFDAENVVVSAKKDDVMFILDIDDETAKKIDSSGEKEVYLYVTPIISDGKTMVGTDFFSQGLGYCASFQTSARDRETAIIFDPTPFAEKIANETKKLGEKYKAIGYDIYNSNPYSMDGFLNVLAQNKTLGITVEGQCNYIVDLFMNHNMVAYSFSADTNGIYNILDMVMGLAENDYDITKTEFNKPIKMNSIVTNDAVYLKWDEIKSTMGYSYPFYRLTDEQKESLSGKWVKIKNEGAKVNFDAYDSEIYKGLFTSFSYMIETNEQYALAEAITESYIGFLNTVVITENEGKHIISSNYTEKYFEDIALNIANKIALSTNYIDEEVGRDTQIQWQTDAVKNFFANTKLEMSQNTIIENGKVVGGDAKYFIKLDSFMNDKLPNNSIQFEGTATIRDASSLNYLKELPPESEVIDVEEFTKTLNGDKSDITIGNAL